MLLAVQVVVADRAGELTLEAAPAPELSGGGGASPADALADRLSGSACIDAAGAASSPAGAAAPHCLARRHPRDRPGSWGAHQDVTLTAVAGAAGGRARISQSHAGTTSAAWRASRAEFRSGWRSRSGGRCCRRGCDAAATGVGGVGGAVGSRPRRAAAAASRDAALQPRRLLHLAPARHAPGAVPGLCHLVLIGGNIDESQSYQNFKWGFKSTVQSVTKYRTLASHVKWTRQAAHEP